MNDGLIPGESVSKLADKLSCSGMQHIGLVSTKRTAILSNKIKRSYSLRHTACRVVKSDMHEDQGSALSQGKRDSKTACCTQS